MSQPWINHAYPYFQYHGISAVSNPDSQTKVSVTTPKIGDVKTKAYVNPSFVKLPYSLPSSGNFGSSQKIHINPNFKRTNVNFFSSSNNSSQFRRESNFIHINPNFNKFQLYDIFNVTSQYECIPQGNKNETDLSQLTILKRDENLSANANQSLQPQKPYSPNQNSTYFWSKYTKKCPKVDEYKPEMEILDNIKNIQIANNLAKLPKIKTRHKIICRTGHRTNAINKDVSAKFNVKNKYKVVNLEKSMGSSSKTVKKVNLTNLSKTNSLSITRKETMKHSFQQVKTKVSNYKTNSIHRLTNLIKTKYKINRLLQRERDIKLAHLTECSGNDYDNRKLSTKNISFRKVLRLCKLESSTNVFKVPKFESNPLWKNKSMKDVERKGKSFPNRALVNIGGIMYKSTTNKLTLASNEKDGSQLLKEVKHEVNLIPGKTGQVVYVRGEKFLLGDGGKTLTKQLNVSSTEDTYKSNVRRVDIGGVTFIQKANNVLTRTNTHQARSLVHQAKQRSIAVLKNLLKRSNMPCMIYNKFGVCGRFKKGVCIYIHDPKNVALCKKFLKGQCDDIKCLLSHNVVEEKMATCHFFLKGNCNRENCPYLHVKVNKNAVICRDFLQGFCSLGQNCKKRHVHQCPDFDEKRICRQGVKCPYPHKSSKSKGKNIKCCKMPKVKPTKKTKCSEKQKSTENLNEGLLRKNGVKKHKSRKSRNKDREETMPKKDFDDSVIECIPKRIKLNDLPLFIPLTSQ